MITFLVNPSSGSGRGRKLWKSIETVLQQKKIDYEVMVSQAPGQLADLAAKACQTEMAEPLRLVVLGGDGSLNEALQGFKDRSRLQLGYIPTGSSNDFARDMGFPKDPLDVLERILQDKEGTPMDLGLLQMETEEGAQITRTFCVSAGIGFDAQVCSEAAISDVKKVLNALGLGKLAYLSIALKQLLTMKRIDATIRDENGGQKQYKKLIFAACMNHRYEGGGFMFCPSANAADGVLNLCAAFEMGLPTILQALPLALNGKHTDFNGVELRCAQRFIIQTSAPCWVHTDGEPLGLTDRITVEILPGAIRMLGLNNEK